MPTVERLIDAGTERVWSLVSDVERWGELLPTMQEVARVGGDGPGGDGAVGDGAVGVGARLRVRQPGLPTAVYEITEWNPGSRFTWVSSSPGVRTTATHEVAAADGRTRLTLGVTWTGLLAGVVVLLLGAKTQRMIEQEAATFAHVAAAADTAEADAGRADAGGGDGTD